MWTETAGADNAVTGDAAAAQQCPLGEALSLVTLVSSYSASSSSNFPFSCKALDSVSSAPLEDLSHFFSQKIFTFPSVSPAEAFLYF